MRDSVLRTICYADIFDYPLTIGETQRFLISRRPTSFSQVRHTLTSLVRNHLLSSSQARVGEEPLFCLVGREKTFSLRRSRRKYSQQKTKKTRKIGKWLKKIPSLAAFYLTGATAMQNAGSIDDIDVMLITKNGQLWTTRLFSTFLLEITQNRRKPASSPISVNLADKFCPNLYLDQTHLSLKLSQRNLYTAHEVAQAKLIWQKYPIHQSFLSQNSWISSYLPNFPIPPHPPFPHFHPRPTSQFIEFLSYHFQVNYMRRRRTRELISPASAFFHPRDTKSIVLGRYHQLLARHHVKPI